MSKYRNKYRVESTQLEGYDYSGEGLYFITICTDRRVHFFGEIIDDEMHLSEIGKIANDQWKKTLEIRKDMNLQLHEFAVMPNHIHGIIEIGKNKYNVCRDAMLGVSHKDDNYIGNENLILDGDTMHRVSTDDGKNTNQNYKNTFSPQSKNIASVIRGYKSAVTTNARRLNNEFSWQSRFHDHIIRNSYSHQKISNYIIENPENWKEDLFY